MLAIENFGSNSKSKAGVEEDELARALLYLPVGLQKPLRRRHLAGQKVCPDCGPGDRSTIEKALPCRNACHQLIGRLELILVVGPARVAPSLVGPPLP